MNKIFKYELEIKDKQTLKVPLNSKVLKVGVIDEKLYVWIIFPLIHEKSSVGIDFIIAVTGSEFKAVGLHYLDTFFLKGGDFVGHLYMNPQYNFGV